MMRFIHTHIPLSIPVLALVSTLIARAEDTIPIPAPVIFFLHEKQSVKSIDSLLALLAPADSLLIKSQNRLSNGDDQSNLSITGYKSFGVSVGELGEVNLEQGLEALIEGEIRPGTTLRAQLSDQGSQLDGSTREISDIDIMFIELTSKRFTVTAGDRYAKWLQGGLLSGEKKIVGISASVTPDASERLTLNAFGSFSGGNHTVQTVKGRDGVQGPYYMTGKGEAGIITPVSGTVRIRLGGREMAEGIDADYTVDYDIGSITFGPRVLVSQDDFIRMEYEYKSFDYRRMFTGGGAAFRAGDSLLSVEGVVWSESDDKNSPIEIQLSEDDKEVLRNSGNKPAYLSSTARPVHPLDVAKTSVFYPLYKKSYEASIADSVLVYASYDPLRPEDVYGFYTALFTPAQRGETGADYVIDTTIERGQFVYKYVGAGQGDYTVLAPVAAPRRESATEIIARLKTRNVKASLNLVGKEVDENLFSEIDDGGNLSAAVMFKLDAGERQLDKRGIWGGVDYRYRSRRFTGEIFSADERKDRWDTDGTGGVNNGNNGVNVVDKSDGHYFHSVESTIGATVAKGAALSVTAGRTYIDSTVETERANIDANARFLRDKLLLTAGAALFKHHLSDIDITYRRYGKLTAKPAPPWETVLDYRDEWSTDTSGRGGGRLSGTAELAYMPAQLRQSANFTQYRKGVDFPGAVDTGYAFTWDQSVAFNPLDKWKLSGSVLWRHTEIKGENSASTFLMSAVSDIEPTKGGFSSRQEYRVNQELSSRFEQKMYHIGKGLGTHAFDSTTGEFRPSVNGDYIIQEVEIYDNISMTTVRKTRLNADWYYRPTKKIRGILGDLSWSGVLSLEEHVDSRNGNVKSYVPGLMSLFPAENEGGTPPVSTTQASTMTAGLGTIPQYPNYADLSYRQDIEHKVRNSLYKTRLYILPGLRIIRSYKEPVFETGLLIERKKNRLLLSVEPRYLTVKREYLLKSQDGQQGNFDLGDISAELVQSICHEEKVEFYIRERGGLVYEKDSKRFIPPPSDSAVYVQIKPGMIYRPTKNGMTELSYTFSYVPQGGELDYRMAGGQQRGTSHIITWVSDIDAGKHFNLSGMYRGESTKRPDAKTFAPMRHVFSFQVKAFL
ncbi:MAG: DUF2460 domain-containing protein [Chitinispirillales bacterium]|nr:DUF2460 domain-containing protein [Chitinispirillales bacterium]